MLDMSKIESGKMQLAETEFELGEWLSGVVTVTQSQTGVRSQHFDVNVWNITHELLCGDTVRLGQVLTNVLGNAVKLRQRTGKSIWISRRYHHRILHLPALYSGSAIPAWA